jgi:hypothetical protein
MLNEEQVIDVTSEEVVEEEVPQLSLPEEDTPRSYIDEYVDFKKQTYRYKQLRKQIQNNIKAQRGFGYTYKEIGYDT